MSERHFGGSLELLSRHGIQRVRKSETASAGTTNAERSFMYYQSWLSGCAPSSCGSQERSRPSHSPFSLDGQLPSCGDDNYGVPVANLVCAGFSLIGSGSAGTWLFWRSPF